ncbi:hypothetical protein [Pseudoalteromonas sp. B160]|uniref:hypothetical protein n=1 Tax=Pseudoalteromonas sp. B160 TaxID=630414 RepID=UPI00301C44DD
MKKIIWMSNIILTLLLLSLFTILITLSMVLFTSSELNLGVEGSAHMWIGLEVNGSWSNAAKQLTENHYNALVWLGLIQVLPFIIINIILLRLFSLYRKGLFLALKTFVASHGSVVCYFYNL